MTSFNEGDVNRATDGKFAAKTTGETDYSTWSASDLNDAPEWEKQLRADAQEEDFQRHMRAAGVSSQETDSPPADRCASCDALIIPGSAHTCTAREKPYWESTTHPNGIATAAAVRQRVTARTKQTHPDVSVTVKSNNVMTRGYTKNNDGSYTQKVSDADLDAMIDEETTINPGSLGSSYASDQDVSRYVDASIKQRFGGIRGSFAGRAEPNYAKITSRGFRYNNDGTLTQKVTESDLDAIIEDNTQFFDVEGNEQDERL